MAQPLPKPVRVLAGVLAAAVGVSAALTSVVAVAGAVRPIWLLFGFEVVNCIAAVLGIAFARGRFSDGQGLAMACVSGTIACSSFFGWLSVRGTLPLPAASVSLTPWLVARVAAGAVLGGIGAYAVLRRNPASIGLFARGAGAGVLLAVLAGGGLVMRHRVLGAIDALPGFLAAVIWLFVAVVACVLLCAAVHYTIRAFEAGRERDAV